MSEFFDLPTIFFLVVLVVVLLRLRSVLGTRDGFQRPDDIDRERKGSVRDLNDNVVKLPPRDQGVPRAEIDAEKQHLKTAAEIERYANGDEKLVTGLNDIITADPDFSPKTFMDGAISAYEMVVVGFAEGDRKTLKMVLDKSVYDDFEAAIDQREAQKHSVKFTFIGFSNVSMKIAEFDGKYATLTVDYASQIIAATRDENGHIVEGDDEAIVNIADQWTWQRPVKSRDPNWKLVSTNQTG